MNNNLNHNTESLPDWVPCPSCGCEAYWDESVYFCDQCGWSGGFWEIDHASRRVVLCGKIFRPSFPTERTFTGHVSSGVFGSCVDTMLSPPPAGEDLILFHIVLKGGREIIQPMVSWIKVPGLHTPLKFIPDYISTHFRDGNK